MIFLAAFAVTAAGGSIAGVLLTRDSSPDENEGPEVSLFLDAQGTPAAFAGCGQAEEPEYQGRTRIEPTDPHPPYSSTPPASGWFSPTAQAAYYEVLPAPEQILSVPANGGIGIHFSEPEALYVRRYHTLARRSDMIAVKDPAIESGVVFVAWGVLLRCEHFSGEVAEEFYEIHGDFKAVKKREPNAVPILR